MYMNKKSFIDVLWKKTVNNSQDNIKQNANAKTQTSFTQHYSKQKNMEGFFQNFDKLTQVTYKNIDRPQKYYKRNLYSQLKEKERLKIRKRIETQISQIHGNKRTQNNERNYYNEYYTRNAKEFERPALRKTENHRSYKSIGQKLQLYSNNNRAVGSIKRQNSATALNNNRSIEKLRRELNQIYEKRKVETKVQYPKLKNRLLLLRNYNNK